MRVVHFHRKPFQNYHSIEGLFDCLRAEMTAKGVDVEKREIPWYSNGVLPRIRSVLWAWRNQGDVNHITGDVHFLALGLAKKRTILTVHDLTILSRKKGVSRFLLKTFWFDLPVKRVAVVTVISEATKKDLLAQCNVPEENVVVIPDAVSPVYQPCAKAFNAESPEILQVGASETKNLGRLFAALEGIPCRLHLVGYPSNDDLKQLRARGISHRISSNLSEIEMYRAYCDADIVTLVSTKEGFGMPILEAQWVERPVVTSNCSSMPEVAGGGACLVDPLDITSIRSGIQRVMMDDTYRTSLVNAGRDNRRRYSLSRVAAEYASLYRRTNSPGP